MSTAEQNPDLQLGALRAAGSYRLFVDTASDALDERPELAKVLDQLRPSDTLVVRKLDRLGRLLRRMIDTIADLQRRDVGFRSLQENIDTTTPGGKLIFHIFGALAEFERDLIRHRTRRLAAARARGRTGGRPPSMAPTKIALARQTYDAQQHSMAGSPEPWASVGLRSTATSPAVPPTGRGRHPLPLAETQRAARRGLAL